MPLFDNDSASYAEAPLFLASYGNEDLAANEQGVYAYLTGNMGLNTAAAAGIMASMYRESRFYVDITNDYGTAYGLCQWYGSRWTNLQNYCNTYGYNWKTLDGQMHFLEYELNSMPSLLSTLRSVPNTAEGAYRAGYDWCQYYELVTYNPSQSDRDRCDSRGVLARDTFWPKYANSGDADVPAGYTGWFSRDGRDYWYENGVRQGTTGRGKEIYDPASDGWYWLDAVQGGAKAVNKDVYQDTNGGKWVRYDANGRMVKGENFQNGSWYYFEPVTGAMVKGPWTLPDGRHVYYDPQYGTMCYGQVWINGLSYTFDWLDGDLTGSAAGSFWFTVDGAQYWYENWVRQGWNPADPNYRGKEIYDPASNAWYWLDNVQQGAKAVSKDVYLDVDGGKWVRYDALGRMVKGWNSSSAGTCYFDPLTGAMAHGPVWINGILYQFDWNTGLLLS